VSRRLTLPERVLQGLGVEQPQEIDLEAIAWDLGARVRYRRLQSCEARIVGRDDRAIITVDTSVLPRRQRFSIAHELGHWRHHRGRCLICRAEDIGDARRSASDPERVADDYASDLLLPRYILEPMLRGVARPSLKAAREVASAFDASLTATLIKIVETDHFPMLLVCHSRDGRHWFRRSASVPSRWFPKDELDHESCAFSLLYGAVGEESSPSLIGADAWFDRAEASDFEILEQAYSLPNNEVCTVLTLKDSRMVRGDSD
jgi:hypothetical protein